MAHEKLYVVCENQCLEEANKYENITDAFVVISSYYSLVDEYTKFVKCGKIMNFYIMLKCLQQRSYYSTGLVPIGTFENSNYPMKTVRYDMSPSTEYHIPLSFSAKLTHDSTISGAITGMQFENENCTLRCEPYYEGSRIGFTDKSHFYQNPYVVDKDSYVFIAGTYLIDE